MSVYHQDERPLNTTGRSDLVCWTNSGHYNGSGNSWRPPCPPFSQRRSDIEAQQRTQTRTSWLVALWIWLFGLASSAHAVLDRDPPVSVGEMWKRPGIVWPRVVTMRFVAGGDSSSTVSWQRVSRFCVVGAPRLIAWRERRATLIEVLRHHGAALYERHGAKLSWRRLLRGHP